jgi:hypothetical protein
LRRRCVYPALISALFPALPTDVFYQKSKHRKFGSARFFGFFDVGYFVVKLSFHMLIR